jgi:WD40 repeat protein
MECIQAESTMSAVTQNPYVGPRTFLKEEGHLFFGRDRESRDLTALVVSERLVLFYAQSGAGKSSLINTRLIPDLEEKLFEVLPVARVSGDSVQGIEVDNIYVFNLIRSLLRRETDPRLLSHLTLSQFLAKLNEDQNGYFYDPNLTAPIRSNLEFTPWPRALIIDQFEEVFSTHAEAWQKREDFFSQLAQAMQDDPYLRLLLVMREDYIAALDPYAHLLPGGLRVRYYMQRLGCEAAIQAVRRPVEQLRPFARGVAEKLVDDLSSIKVQKLDGTIGLEAGQYVEPVQLQVVCYSLWQNLPPGKIRITMQDLHDVGDVDTSLGNYYAERVKAVAETHNVNERRIRKWFSDKLISPGGMRNMVLKDPAGESDGLGNDVIQALPDLLRTEQRGGAVFYELTHDRLVKPVLENNQAWEEQHLSLFQRRAILWNTRDRSEGLLLRGRELINAEDEAKNAELTDLEKAFLNASKRGDRAVKERRRSWLVFLSCSSLIVVIAICSGLIIAATNYSEAIVAKSTAQASQGTAQASEAEAKHQLLRSESFRFALQAKMLLANDVNSNPELAALLSLMSTRASNNKEYLPEADAALVESMERLYTVRTFVGHTDEVMGIAVSRDGKYLATCSEDSTVKIWEIETGNLARTLEGHESWVSDVAFSPDGTYVLTGSFDHTAKIWDVASGEAVLTLSGHADTILGVAYSPDGAFVLTSSSDKTAKLWDAGTGHEVHSLSGHQGAVWDVAFSTAGDLILTGSADMTAKTWDIHTGIEKATFEGYGSEIYSVAFSPDDKQILLGGRSTTAEVWDIAAHEKLLSLDGHYNTINAVKFSGNGYYILTGSFDGSAILWSAKTGEILRGFGGHSNWVKSVAFSPDDQFVFTGSADGTAKMWLTSGNLLPRKIAGKDEIENVIFFPDGESFLTAGPNGYAIVWSTSTGKGLQVYKGLNAYSNAAAISADSQSIVAINNDGITALWNAKTGEEIRTYGDQIAWSVAMSPNSDYVLTGGSDGIAKLWETSSGMEVKTFQSHEDGILSAAFSPDGKLVLTSSNDYTAKLWDVETGKEILTIEHPLDPTKGSQVIWSVAFSPDGKYLLTGSFDNTVRLWTASTGEEIRVYRGHTDRVLGVTFSSDGKYILTGSADKTARLWNTETGELIRTLSGHTGKVYSVAFSPDDQSLVTASEDGTARLWDLEFETTIDLACSLLTRDFTTEEAERYGITDVGPTCPPEQVQMIPVTGNVIPAPAEIESLLYSGHVLETLAVLDRGQKSDPGYTNSFDAEFWNLLCWDGSLNGYFVEVGAACERAVTLAPDNGNYIDSRGLNGALQGNFEEAIEDFEYAVIWLRNNQAEEELIKKRELWISMLREGINPFDAEMLEDLKSE